jgi:hypothetical protein
LIVHGKIVAHDANTNTKHKTQAQREPMHSTDFKNGETGRGNKEETEETPFSDVVHGSREERQYGPLT